MANLNEEIKNDCKKIIELIDNKHVVVKHEDVDRISNLGNFFGLIVFGGSFIGNEYQCLYID